MTQAVVAEGKPGDVRKFSGVELKMASQDI